MATKKKGGLGGGIKSLGLEGTFENKGVKELPVDKIEPNPNQPRKHFHEDDMETLKASIAHHGLVQPIIVRKVDHHYQIVAGERRWRAVQALGLSTIPVVIKDYSTEEVSEIALVENLQRQDLDPIEEAFAYQRLMEQFKQTQEHVAARLGRSRSHVANMVRLLQLPEFLRDELSSGELTIGQVRPLLALPSEDLQLKAWHIIKEKELNARQVEQLVKDLHKGKAKPKKKAKKAPSAEWKLVVDRLKLNLGAPVAITLKNEKKVEGKIEITFSNEEELQRLLDYMEP